jgi:pilus assembly protein CpaF
MFTIVVTEKGGEPKKLQFDDNKTEIKIGRVNRNDIVLPKGNVSKGHAVIQVRNGEFVIHDNNSTNGTYVDGRRITSSKAISPSNKVFIGEFMIYIEGKGNAQNGSSEPQEFDDDLFEGMEDEFSSPANNAPAGNKPPPPRKAPPALDDPFGDMEDDFGVPESNNPPAPPPRRQSPPPMDMDDEFGFEDPGAPPPPPPRKAPPRKAPPRKAPPPRKQAPPPMDIDDEFGFEDPKAVASAPPRKAPPRKAPPRKAPPRKAPAKASQPPKKKKPKKVPMAPPKKKYKKGDPKVERIAILQKEIHTRLIDRMDLRKMDLDEIPEDELWDRTDAVVCEIVDQMSDNNEIPSFVDQDELIKDVLNEALGLGPLEDFLADDTISEIMVNHATQIYVEQNGKITLSEKVFSSDKAVLGVIERIVAPIGRRIDESSPLVDARLKDGSRVNAIIPPLALKGPCITIRKFKRDVLGVEELIKFNTLTRGMADFLRMCVLARKNMIISGGTGSGKTTTLNIISNFIPETERIITLEDAAELQIQNEHWIQLESRPPNIEGTGAITIRDLMKNTLRMRPDRVIVGECRGGEALDMLQAMNTGHDGSMTTAHANNPRDVLARLETMVMMSGMDLPIKAIREQVASALDIIVQQSRFSDGSRRITYISEVTGMEGEIITLQDIFKFKQEGYNENNKVLGRYMATGFMPKFYDDLRRKGIPVDMSIFREN